MSGRHPIAEVLSLLAEFHSTGTLHATGPVSGEIEVAAGMVVAIHTDAVPSSGSGHARPEPATGLPPQLVDAATALLASPSTTPPRFTSGEGEEAPAGPRYRIDLLLEAAESELERLRGCEIGPDDEVTLTGSLAPEAVVHVGASCWPLLGWLHRPNSSRALAHAAGRNVVDTVVTVDGLIRQGLCHVVARPTAPTTSAVPGPPPHPGLRDPAAGRTARRPSSRNPTPPRAVDGDEHGAVPGHPNLPSRRREAPREVRGHPRGAEPRHRPQTPPTPAAMALTGAPGDGPDADLVLRLIEGVRRL